VLLLNPCNGFVVVADSIISGRNIIVKPKAFRVRRDFARDLTNAHLIKEGRISRKPTGYDRDSLRQTDCLSSEGVTVTVVDTGCRRVIQKQERRKYRKASFPDSCSHFRALLNEVHLYKRKQAWSVTREIALREKSHHHFAGEK
jgi:hypothetical protein